MNYNDRIIKEINGEVRIYVREELINPKVLEQKLSSFPDCHIRSIEQSGKKKAHYGLFDKNNQLVFEVAAPQRSAYARMAKIKDLPIMNVKLYKNPSYSEYTADFLPDLRPLQDYSHPIKRIVLDTETTGLNPGLDEILQISIIDGDGNMLLNNYYKPEHVDSWAAAARINHITKAMVKDKPSVYQDVEKIQAILNQAQEVVIYNAPFDLSFLADLDLLLDTRKVRDTMREYGQLFHGKEYYKLQQAAKECHFVYNAHDSLSDCRATLAVQNAVDSAKRYGTSRAFVSSSRSTVREPSSPSGIQLMQMGKAAHNETVKKKKSSHKFLKSIIKSFFKGLH
ncbi:3'-5' exonuclease [Aeriscardovia aeriphila]|uniref:DNA polymerase III subunit epsilon n=1 Tax=Aeriscardovia aeriphila TaxID=218139 RepID=A0A261FAN9_9BIFI|nr:3'-5' exonuclease [Aeriscardovia aeriphila]NYI25818.1 DNA polymerase III epsilon subunit-like protein [Aeriscardovia aeriphila]OZG56033.1 DNA polymerase III subunit epsilon [Aeriscardovia aeriphila]